MSEESRFVTEIAKTQVTAASLAAELPQIIAQLPDPQFEILKTATKDLCGVWIQHEEGMQFWQRVAALLRLEQTRRELVRAVECEQLETLFEKTI